jgi:arylsulfatase A-like enzyme
VSPGKRIRTGVSLVDVAPTLLDLAGVPRDSAMTGRSLLTTVTTGEEPEEIPILAESVEYGPDRFASIVGPLKIILTPLPQRFNSGVAIRVAPLEIFDLSADPAETRNLAAAPPPGASRLTEDLWKHVETVFKPLDEERGRKEIPQKLLDQLRSLGYVQ